MGENSVAASSEGTYVKVDGWVLVPPSQRAIHGGQVINLDIKVLGAYSLILKHGDAVNIRNFCPALGEIKTQVENQETSVPVRFTGQSGAELFFDNHVPHVRPAREIKLYQCPCCWDDISNQKGRWWQPGDAIVCRCGVVLERP